jgi:MFS family permease
MSTSPQPSLLSRRASFWAIAFAFLSLTALSTAPSALYRLYAQHDHFSSLTITIVYAVYVVGVLASLLLAGHVSDWYGRRGVLGVALMLAIVSAVVFIASESLVGLVAGRIVTGVAIGAGIATATAYLSDLDAGPNGVPTQRAGIVSTLANVGGLALGPLVAGLLARYATNPLRLPYVVLAAAVGAGLLAVLGSVEGHSSVRPRPPYHPQRFKAPAQGRTSFVAALTGAFTSFAVFGLIAGLVGTLLADTFHHTSPALTGLAVFVTFGSGAVAQTTTTPWPTKRVLLAGTGSAILGLCILVGSAWMAPPSLALFLIGGVITGAGCGGIFRGSLETAIAVSTAEDRAGTLATFFAAGYAGISVPVVGAGVAIQFVSPRVTLLLFGVGVGVGLLSSAPMLVRPRDGDTRSTGHAAELGRRPTAPAMARATTETRTHTDQPAGSTHP